MVVITQDAAPTRPSLFATISTVRATIRLAKVTAAFKRELKARVGRPRDNPFDVKTRRAFKNRAYHSLDRDSISFQKGRVCKEGAVEDDASVEWLNFLLKELDENSGIFNGPLTKVTADSRLFLAPEAISSSKSPGSTSWTKAAYEYDLVTLLVLALDRRVKELNTERKISDNDGFDTDILSDEICSANLQHFLLCLQRRLFDALLRKTLVDLEENAREWQKYWQQQRKLGTWWFFEWPSGRRPLSTTWPWNIKPSLVVLWGVCWMFYEKESKSPIRADICWDSEAFWERMPFSLPDPSEGKFESTNIPISPRPRGSSTAEPSLTIETAIPAPQWPSSPGPDGIYRHGLNGSPIQGSSPGEYITSSDSDTFFRASEPLQEGLYSYDTPFASRVLGRPTSSNVDALPGSFTRPQTESLFTSPLVTCQAPTPPGAESSLSWTKVLNPGPRQDFEGVSPFPNFNEHTINLLNMHDNPVPGSVHPRKRSVSPVTPTENNGEDSKSPISIISGVESEPPRNERNQLICLHADCAAHAPVFLRRCEWRKHTDKHDRPYRCKSVGCEKLQGFTYSGGLLRHEREVHKKHGGPKERMMCPYPDCKRSSGVGFTRKENLNEHKRRVHRNSGDIKREELDDVGEPSEEETLELPRKRKRSVVSELSVSAGEGGDGDDLRFKVLRLQQEIYVHAKRSRVMDDRLLATDNRLLGTESRLRHSEQTIVTLTEQMSELRRLIARPAG
ncbi:MAG: hypothetical protein M1812_006029 [Candelaria pacifica]|nr:MAG: hypothetical protein M1812_006029 [Candelaria pacifica]